MDNMMGLESIALAAAQLEHASTAESPPSIPPKQSWEDESSSPSPRTVSTDSSSSLIPASREEQGQVLHRGSGDIVHIIKNSDGTDGASKSASWSTLGSVTPPDPTEVITEVREADVLCGRGGETNHHAGNVWYRNLVKKKQLMYLKAKRRDKPRIARYIVDQVRQQGGRFLKKDTSTNTWRDVGNTKAREKTSQALREGAPELRTDSNGKSVANVQQSQRKKRKLDKSNAESTSTVNTTTPSTAAIVSPAAPTSPPISTVSSTDEDSTSSAETPLKKQKRGPRLKIFKARLNSIS